MKEIYARGPVAACMACPFDEFEKGYTGGIFATTNNRTVRRSHEPTSGYSNRAVTDESAGGPGVRPYRCGHRLRRRGHREHTTPRAQHPTPPPCCRD